MHVSPGPDPRRSDLVRVFLRDAETEALAALGTEDLAAQRAGNRAILAHRYELIWKACEEHVRGEDSEGQEVLRDFRYVDLAARVTDKMGRLLQVHLPDPPAAVGGDQGAAVRAKVTAAVDELEEKLREEGS